jgi:hypothetical protein
MSLTDDEREIIDFALSTREGRVAIAMAMVEPIHTVLTYPDDGIELIVLEDPGQWWNNKNWKNIDLEK